jgi:hypothetical protein
LRSAKNQSGLSKQNLSDAAHIFPVSQVAEVTAQTLVPCGVQSGSASSRALNGRSGRVILRAVSSRLLDAIIAADSRESEHNSRIALGIVRAILENCAYPVDQSYSKLDKLCRKHGTCLYAPRIGVAVSLAARRNLIAAETIAAGTAAAPERAITLVDGRNASAWLLSVNAYLEARRVSAVSKSDAAGALYYVKGLRLISGADTYAPVAPAAAPALQFSIPVSQPISTKEKLA